MNQPIKDCFAAQHEQANNPKLLAKKHNDEKLSIIILIMGAGLIALASTLAKYHLHPHYNVTKPNEQHQFGLFYVPHNIFERNTY